MMLFPHPLLSPTWGRVVFRKAGVKGEGGKLGDKVHAIKNRDRAVAMGIAGAGSTTQQSITKLATQLKAIIFHAKCVHELR